MNKSASFPLFANIQEGYFIHDPVIIHIIYTAENRIFCWLRVLVIGGQLRNGDIL